MGRADPPIAVDDVEAEVLAAGEIDARRRRLGIAAGARRIGVAIADVLPGARLTPPHAHADEDELFYVLSGSGLSWQSSGRRDVRTYAVGPGDVLFHPSNGDAHTMIAGDGGLRVLILAEGSRTNITQMPRTGQFLIGPRWMPADSRHPFAADAALGPLEVPEPTAERPPSIVARDDVPLDAERRGRIAFATRDVGRAAGARRIVLAHEDLPPDVVMGPSHWHTQAEEAFLVLSGSGVLRIGDVTHPVREGSFVLRTPGAEVGHRFESGPDGLELLVLGDKVPGDVCVYPDSRKIAVRPGVLLPMSDLSYFDGEPDAG